MTLKITKSNETGFGTVAGDELGRLVAVEGQPDPTTNYLKTVYEGSPFSVDIDFQGEYVDEITLALTYQNAVSVTVNTDVSVMGLTVTPLTTHSIRISGSQINAFPGTYYQFLMPDYTLKVLPPDTTEPYLTLVKYHMPPVTTILKDIQMTVVIPPAPVTGGTGGTGGTGSNTTVQVTMQQYVHWVYASAQAAVKAAVARGSK